MSFDRKNYYRAAAASTVFLSSLPLVLPDGLASILPRVLLPLLLLAGSAIAFKVSGTYRSHLKWAFVFLSMTLLIFSPLHLPGLFPDFAVGSGTVEALLMHGAAYSAAGLFCLYVLKVMDLGEMARRHWAVLLLASALALPILVVETDLLLSSLETGAPPVSVASDWLLDLLDVSIALSLLPVVLLYRLHHGGGESTTFTLAVTGLILGILSGHIHKLAFPATGAGTGTEPLLDSMLLFSYSLTLTGLYGHLALQRWGPRESAVSFEELKIEAGTPPNNKTE